LIDLFYLKFDNANVLKLLKDKDAAIDSRGNYSTEELAEFISSLKDGDEVADAVFPSYLSTFISEYFNTPAEDDFLHEDRLAALYYAYAMKCRNILNFRAVSATSTLFIVRLNANQEDTNLFLHFIALDQLVKISETEELVEREKKIDQLRWNWMEEATFFNS